MKKFLVVILIFGAGFFVWQKYTDRFVEVAPLYDKPYIVVYGRDSCSWTARYLKDFRTRGLPCIYKRVDDENVCKELHPRMQKAGLNPDYYLLPVIDVNASLFIRPELEIVLSTYTKN
jgi:hypothetical protein